MIRAKTAEVVIYSSGFGESNDHTLTISGHSQPTWPEVFQIEGTLEQLKKVASNIQTQVETIEKRNTNGSQAVD